MSPIDATGDWDDKVSFNVKLRLLASMVCNEFVMEASRSLWLMGDINIACYAIYFNTNIHEALSLYATPVNPSEG